MLLEQTHRKARVHVMGQHQDPDPGMPLTDLLSCDDALVGVRGWHPDVDDRDVGLVLVDYSLQRRGLADGRDHFEADLAEQSRQPFPEE